MISRMYNLQWLAVLLLCSSPHVVKAQSPSQSESKEAYQKRMEWFDEAKLGIFIHRGIYAVDGDSKSWSFYNNYIPYHY